MSKTKATKRTVDPWSKGKLKTTPMNQIATRPGSMEILNKPSRIANTLFYPDGKVTKGE